MPALYWWLLPLGFAVGVFGTLVGAGGGFLLVPILLILFPQDEPARITGISLAVVFFNAFSGSISYARMRRIDYRAGLTFAAAGVPGALLGAYGTYAIPRRAFDILMGATLLAGAIYIAARSRPAQKPLNTPVLEHDASARSPRTMWLGIALSFVVGLLSTLLGIGGGIIHVPALIYLLGFPLHTATATSHFILAILAFTGTAAHAASGAFLPGWRRAALLSAGAVIGAPIGARLSRRVRAEWIARGLATALALAALRLLATLVKPI